MFVVQAHWSRRFHVDLRLEVGDRLVSWALPKGPSASPGVRRLAIRTPDHPLDYALFEGAIPSGEYGAGVVLVWDVGGYEALRPTGVGADAWIDRGFLRLHLHGEHLQGLWELVRYPASDARGHEAWLLLKLRDRHAGPAELLEEPLRSVLSHRTREEIAREAAAGGPLPVASALAACDPRLADAPETTSPPA